jgi:hypothetical protein
VRCRKSLFTERSWSRRRIRWCDPDPIPACLDGELDGELARRCPFCMPSFPSNRRFPKRFEGKKGCFSGQSPLAVHLIHQRHKAVGVQYLCRKLSLSGSFDSATGTLLSLDSLTLVPHRNAKRRQGKALRQFSLAHASSYYSPCLVAKVALSNQEPNCAGLPQLPTLGERLYFQRRRCGTGSREWENARKCRCRCLVCRMSQVV